MKKTNLWYRILHFLLKIILFSFLRVKVTGRENIDKNKQYVIMCNHSGWIDSLIVMLAMPSSSSVTIFAEKASAYQKPLILFIFKITKLHFVEVERANQDSRTNSVKESLKSLKSGSSLLIFPEGRINTTDGTFFPFYKGGFFLAKRQNTEVLPMYMRGSERAYLGRRINLNIGKPIGCDKDKSVEEFLTETYMYMKEIMPDKPINKAKNARFEITELMIGPMAAPAPITDSIIADGLEASETFAKTNRTTRTKTEKENN